MGMGTMAIVLVLCVMFIVVLGTGFFWRAGILKVISESTGGHLKQYSFKEIRHMTDRFKQKLGRGGQGVVYLGTLPEGGKVAVKWLQKKADDLVVASDNHTQELIKKAFWAELMTISRLHHSSLVALLGYCVEDDELFLVYEYMGKGSLSQRLHDEGMVLDWHARLRCAVQVAQGLEYLHSHANPPLVHGDIKPGNILLDDDMNAKIADFGLSKEVAAGHAATVTTHLRCTPGYVDPVYFEERKSRYENDVYSFGVVLLELLTGRKAIEQSDNANLVIQQKVNLVEWCKDILGPDEHMTRRLLPCYVDNRISLDISNDQLYEVLKVARSCLKDKQEDRPTMQYVAAWLHVKLDKTWTFVDCSPSYEITVDGVIVKCPIAGSTIELRCKIWPTLKKLGPNKVEASLNGKILWSAKLWWRNAMGSREFIVGNGVKLIVEWQVWIRFQWRTLPLNDPRRRMGPFVIQYLAIKDEHKSPLIEYFGDRSPLVSPHLEWKPSRESSGSGPSSGGSGSGSAERRKSNHPRRMS